MAEYFFTSRNIKRPRNGAEYFGDEPAEMVTYVIAPDGATTMSPADRVTGPNRASRWANAILEDATQLWEQNAPHPENAPVSGDIVVFVHGYNTDAQDVFESHIELAKNLRDNGLTHAVFVSYSWSSRGDFWNYLEDDSDARQTAIHLVQSGLAVFAAFSTPDCRVRVHVLAHSMGALVVREAFRAAPGAKPTREGAWGLTQLITFGADISVRSMQGREGDLMLGKSQRFTNYFNRRDAVLATSNVKRFASSPRLGRHGAPPSRLAQIVDVDVTERWQNVSSRFDGQDKFRESHRFYRGDPVFALDVVHTILGDLDRREIPTRVDSDEEGRLKLVPQI
ncbi:alpha/beta hydrolase [Pseudoruegeria sp. HB172150]|uniref:alpha/beta hydrolase n=1 Tax=Pseudoruegeria sp. HB172150 TaxID=2721164 RepID=UPI0015522729|nr:alpha/beta hydrolase [Pseudoruegeria sp. HB172150]